MRSLYTTRHEDSDRGSVSRHAHALQKPSKPPEHPSPACRTGLALHRASVLPALTSWSSLPQAISCNIYKSQRAKTVGFWKLFWAHTSPKPARNISPSSGRFQHCPCSSNPGAQLCQADSTCAQNWAGGAEGSPGLHSRAYHSTQKGLMQSLCNLSLVQITLHFLCGFSFHPICSWRSSVLFI